MRICSNNFSNQAANPRRFHKSFRRAVVGLLGILSILSFPVAAQFQGGDGSSTDPWLVATPQQLDAVRTYADQPAQHFKLIADLDLGGSNPAGMFWNNGAGWDPLGLDGFRAVLDGNGHVVSGLYINRPASGGPVGLIALLDGGRVENVGLTNFEVVGRERVAGLVGHNFMGTIRNSSAEGDVTGVNIVGGLVARNDGIVINSQARGSVIGDFMVGGLVGVSTGVIRLGFADSDVTAALVAGGLAGQNEGELIQGASLGQVEGLGAMSVDLGGLAGVNKGTIRNSYSRAVVSGGQWRVGGLVGWNEGGVFNTYSAGKVTASALAGGLIGWGEGAFSNNFWDVDTSGQAESIGATGKSTAQMQVATTYSGWNFQDIWRIGATGYPEFRPVSVFDGTFDGGVGSREDPWIISDARQLDAVREHMDKHFVLAADIDLGGKNPEGLFWNDGKGWRSLGDNFAFAATPFTGSLNGNGHVISGLYVNRVNYVDVVGLFAAISDGILVDVHIANADITGNNSGGVGALAGRSSGSIEHSSASGVIAGDLVVGGLVGYSDGDIVNSHSSAKVSGREAVGGLAGFNAGSISHGSAGAQVTGTGLAAGGLVGRNTGQISASSAEGVTAGEVQAGGLVGSNGGLISNSHASGTLSGTSAVGGLVGSNAGTVASSYARTAISGTELVGGLVGQNFATVSSSYWDTQASGLLLSAGGEGKTSAELRQRTTFVNWDFAYNWQMGLTGYPVIQELVEFAGGEGSVASPWEIATAAQLSLVRNHLDGHFILVADIDLGGNDPNGRFWNGGKGWEPLGWKVVDNSYLQYSPFTGSFDGRGHTIRGLYINRPDAVAYVGLFAQLSGELRDVELIDVSVSGAYVVGGLVGMNESNGSIRSSSVSGTVIGNLVVGQIAGYNYGTIAGDADNPVLLENSYIASGALLENVIVGHGNTFVGGVEVGTNVRFLSNDLIPAGSDLSRTLDRIFWPGEPFEAIDLQGDVLVPAAQGETLEEGIRQLYAAECDCFELWQNPATGELVIQSSQYLAVVLPVRVLQADEGLPEGIHSSADGDVVFVTASGRVIVAQPMLRDLVEFRTGMAGSGLIADVGADGGLNISLDGSSNRYAARPGMTMPAQGTNLLGLQTAPYAGLPNVAEHSFVFRNGAGGEVLRQTLVPRPMDWHGFREFLLALPQVESVRIDTDGRIRVRANGILIEARASYLVTARVESAPGYFSLLSVADANGDGLDDYLIGYPDGGTQLLYRYPID